MQETQANNDTLDSGSYEIIRKRLQHQKETLSDKLQLLNTARKEIFNSKIIVDYLIRVEFYFLPVLVYR